MSIFRKMMLLGIILLLSTNFMQAQKSVKDKASIEERVDQKVAELAEKLGLSSEQAAEVKRIQFDKAARKQAIQLSSENKEIKKAASKQLKSDIKARMKSILSADQYILLKEVKEAKETAKDLEKAVKKSNEKVEKLTEVLDLDSNQVEQLTAIYTERYVRLESKELDKGVVKADNNEKIQAVLTAEQWAELEELKALKKAEKKAKKKDKKKKKKNS